MEIEGVLATVIVHVDNGTLNIGKGLGKEFTQSLFVMLINIQNSFCQSLRRPIQKGMILIKSLGLSKLVYISLIFSK